MPRLSRGSANVLSLEAVGTLLASTSPFSAGTCSWPQSFDTPMVSAQSQPFKVQNPSGGRRKDEPQSGIDGRLPWLEARPLEQCVLYDLFCLAVTFVRSHVLRVTLLTVSRLRSSNGQLALEKGRSWEYAGRHAPSRLGLPPQTLHRAKVPSAVGYTYCMCAVKLLGATQAGIPPSLQTYFARMHVYGCTYICTCIHTTRLRRSPLCTCPS